MYILAKALIEWTPVTFYVVCALVHCVVIYFGFKFVQVDDEYISWVSTAIVSAAIGVIGYFAKDWGFGGMIVIGVVIYGGLLFSSGIDIFRSLAVFGLCLGTYILVGIVVVPRTPLTTQQIGGLPQALISKNLNKNTPQKKNDIQYVDENDLDDADLMQYD